MVPAEPPGVVLLDELLVKQLVAELFAEQLDAGNNVKAVIVE